LSVVMIAVSFSTLICAPLIGLPSESTTRPETVIFSTGAAGGASGGASCAAAEHQSGTGHQPAHVPADRNIQAVPTPHSVPAPAIMPIAE
jgi:hypothetical protein